LKKTRINPKIKNEMTSLNTPKNPTNLKCPTREKSSNRTKMTSVSKEKKRELFSSKQVRANDELSLTLKGSCFVFGPLKAGGEHGWREGNRC
jgi:hypothetical protein